MPSEPTICASVAERLAVVADGESTLDGLAAQHVEACLRCQAEQAGYRRLLKAMHDLRDAPLSVDAALEHEILFAIDRRDGRVRSLISSRVAAAVGGVAAGAAAAAGVIALTVRQRRVARLAS